MSYPLVVLTYPGHFIFTTLTIKSYLKHHRPSRIIVLIDDLSPLAWPNYGLDCKNLYGQFDVEILKASDFEIFKKFYKDGWVRQQIIKLYLDTVIDCNEFFFSDGDIVFLHQVDHDSVPYSEPIPTLVTESNNAYVSDLLGIDNPGFFINEKQICVSNPAFRNIKSEWLPDLRSRAEQHIKTSFDDYHVALQYGNAFVMSEWELIENFKYHNLGMQLNLVKYAPNDFFYINHNLDFFDHRFITCYCTDAGVGQQWFLEQEIEEVDKYWHLIKDIHK